MSYGKTQNAAGQIFKERAGFTEAGCPRELANALKEANLRLARRKPHIRGQEFKCSAKEM